MSSEPVVRPPGTLFLLPVPLTDGGDPSMLPDATLSRLRQIDRFVVEKAKTARAHLRALAFPKPLQSVPMVELDGTRAAESVAIALDWLQGGHDVGLMSEAGCPGVADPGSTLVARCHEQGIRVAPLVGPSSLLLAVMASGMNGQCFTFHGYLPTKPAARREAIRDLERRSRSEASLQIFIETPYRNLALFSDLLATCQPSTRLGIACDLGLTGELIHSASTERWRKFGEPKIDRRPTVFTLEAAGRPQRS